MKEIIQKLKGRLQPYQPIPFWSWNGKLNENRLIQQIDEMKQDGCGGYFMHARSGLQTEYLSEEWLKCVEACVEHGNETGMDAWIYDENGWPSGFVGGKLLEKEKFHDQYLLHTIGKFESDADLHYKLDGDRLTQVTSSEEGKEYLNLYIQCAVSTVDILNPEVTEAFLDHTHEVYKRYFGGTLSGKVRGFFSDEPQYHRSHTAYTDMLPDYFYEKYGENIYDGLGLLFVEKKGYEKFRYRYWRAMQELMLTNFSKKVYGWCEENQLQFTGHYIEETSLSGQMECCAGVMPFYKYMHIPGIDWIASWSENELPPRQVGSVAMQYGKKHVLTESYASFGWQVTPRELKRITEFQFVSGVNLLCQHLLPYSEAGQTKRDFPAHYSSINPWVKEDGAGYNNYMTRLGYLLAESEEQVNVAVLHPNRSAYLVYQREEEKGGKKMAELDARLLEAVRSLSSRGINYHFLDETLLAEDGFVTDAFIGCGKCSYSFLVLPHVTNMDCSTEKLLHQYVKNGGKVLVLGNIPKYLEGEEYDYGYLRCNCSIEQIQDAQPCRPGGVNPKVYSSYRKLGEHELLFVMNMDKKNGQDCDYDCQGRAKSFEQMDLSSLTTKSVPMKIHLEPGESAILFLKTQELTQEGQQELQNEARKPVVNFRLQNARPSFKQNYLTVDQVQYSTDGKIYSEKYYIPALFEKLLKERYEGEIYFRYEFEVESIPDQIMLIAESGKAKEYRLNGCPITFDGISELDPDFLTADIRSYLQEGENAYTVRMDWYQNEDVYFALFGENVTESLKNKLVYDCELESVYVCGTFGVYTKGEWTDAGDGYVHGKDFYIGAMPDKITEPVRDGLPFFAGQLSLKQKLHLTQKHAVMQFSGTWQLVRIKLNGVDLGELMFGDKVDISRAAIDGENELELEVTISNRNLLGPHHSNHPLMRLFVGPDSFTLEGTWQDRVSPLYRESYELLKLGMV